MRKALNETHAYEIIEIIKPLVNNTYSEIENITSLDVFKAMFYNLGGFK